VAGAGKAAAAGVSARGGEAARGGRGASIHKVEKKAAGGNSIKAEDIPAPGYHWFKLGTFPIAPGYYAYFFWSWIIQVDVDNVFDPLNPDQKFEVWARIKFEGPRFPHAKPGDKDAIYVKRLVLVKTEF
jgi:hypothetical protein